MLNLLLAEDHNIVRNGISVLLEADKEISIAGEAVNGRQAMDMIAGGLQVDIILADVNMPELDGISMIKELKILSPGTRVMILSMLDNEKYVVQAFSAGASGYLLKNVSADELIFALKHVHNGGKYLCAELSIRLLDKLISSPVMMMNNSKPKVEFTERELEILNLIAEGLTNSEMSEKLYISKRTIEGHRQNLIERTGSKNTAALIRFAVSCGVVK